MKKALFEALFVALGVVLALAANEWRENLAREALAREAYAGVVEELRSNREAVETSAVYHRERLDLIAAAGESGETPAQFERGFLLPAQLSHAAWDSASETGALGEMPFRRVLELGRVYAEQEAYREHARNAAAVINRVIFEEGIEGVSGNPRGVASTIGAFLYLETGLIAVYDKVLSTSAAD